MREGAGGVGKCGKMCWGVREGEGRCGIGVGKCIRMWGRCGKVYGVSVGKYVGAWGEVRKKVGKGMEEGKRRCGMCKEVWGKVWKSVWR